MKHNTPTRAAAADHINTLRADGMESREIGRLAGRDSSIVTFVARGYDRPISDAVCEAILWVKKNEKGGQSFPERLVEEWYHFRGFGMNEEAVIDRLADAYKVQTETVRHFLLAEGLVEPIRW